MKKLKVMTVVGTRPEIIRLSAVIKRLNESEAIEHTLVHTGQNYDYELNEVFFKDFDLKKPDYFLNAASDSAVETIGNLLVKIDVILKKVEPEAFLILGDTNSCLCAIAAKKRKIPIFHMEAGNRCFDQRVPEETNRKIVDHISDINLPYSTIARDYLLREGLPADQVIKTGSPMLEVLNNMRDKINHSKVLEKLNLQKNNFFLVSAHREENINNSLNLEKLVESLNIIAATYKLPVIISTHPRTKKAIKEKKMWLNPLIHQLKPMGFSDYNKLQISARAVLSDSGTISEESSILKFKALNLRESHERPEAMEEGSVILVGLEKNTVLQGIELLSDKNYLTSNEVSDYKISNVSSKVEKIIISYTHYINKKVWKKNI